MMLVLLYQFDDSETGQYMNALGANLQNSMTETRGSVLVFLPGMQKCQRL